MKLGETSTYSISLIVFLMHTLYPRASNNAPLYNHISLYVVWRVHPGPQDGQIKVDYQQGHIKNSWEPGLSTKKINQIIS